MERKNYTDVLIEDLEEEFRQQKIAEAMDFTEAANSKDNLITCPNCGAHNDYSVSEKDGDKVYTCNYCTSVLYREPMNNQPTTQNQPAAKAQPQPEQNNAGGIESDEDKLNKQDAQMKADPQLKEKRNQGLGFGQSFEPYERIGTCDICGKEKTIVVQTTAGFTGKRMCKNCFLKKHAKLDKDFYDCNMAKAAWFWTQGK